MASVIPITWYFTLDLLSSIYNTEEVMGCPFWD